MASLPVAGQSTVLAGADEHGHVALTDASALSGDGRWLGLEASFPLVESDVNGWPDVFVRDLSTGAVELVSVSTGGVQGDGSSGIGALSHDGRFVLFFSEATTFTSIPPVARQGYVRDRAAGTTTLVTCGNAGVPVNDAVWDSDFSDDANLVVFACGGTNLGFVDNNGGESDVFLRDVAAGSTTLISANALGQTGHGASDIPTISGDGRWIAYVTRAYDIAGYGGSHGAILIHDRANGTTTRVDAPGAAHFDDFTGGLSFNLDGRWLAISSTASNLVAADNNDVPDVFVFDRSTGGFQLLSHSNGVPANDYSFYPSITPDGRRVVFNSRATDLVPNDTNGASDVFIADVASGVVTRASVTSNGSEGEPAWDTWQGVASRSAISDDSRYVAFVSFVKGLAPGDEDEDYHGYLRDNASPCAPVTQYCTAKINSLGCAPRIFAIGDPRSSGPDAFFVCAFAVVPDVNGRLLWGIAPTATPFAGGTLCVAQPFVRSPVRTAGGWDLPWVACSRQIAFHFSHAYQSAHGVGAGSTIYAQFWTRDPGLLPPDAFSLTNAIQLTLGP